MTERPSSELAAPALRVGDWVVHPRLNRIVGPPGEIQIEPRLMSVLVFLASSPGEVFSRNELLDRVWGDVVVGEEALTRAISELRRVLGDDPQKPVYIETIRKGGYRLVASVETLPEVSRPANTPPTAVTLPPRRGRAWVWPAVAVVAAAAVWFGWRRPNTPPTGSAGEPLRTIPLTSYPGRETLPALSPDGSLVAFGWSGPDENNMDIYIKQIGEEPPLRLTDDPGWDTYPVWGPDAKSLDYIHADEAGQGIWRVPLVGGVPREILSARHLVAGFTWLDENTLVYSDAEVKDGPGRLFRRDFSTGEDQSLLSAPDDASDVIPLIGPDGATLAFIRAEPGGVMDIHLLDLTTGELRRLTTGLENVEGLCWDRTGESLVFASRMSGNYTLWRAAVADGALRWIPVHGEWMFFPSVARNADRMAFQHRWFEKNVWRVTIGDDPSSGLSTEPVIASTQWDCEAYYSPDANHLAFTSARSGDLEIWACQADGGRPVQLTHFGGPSVGAPCWSPEGSRIALAASPDGFSNLFVAEYAGRTIRRVTQGRHHDLAPSWSRDGRWLYCGSNRDGTWQIWKVPANGDSSIAPVRMTSEGGVRAREAADGSALYFARKRQAGLWRIPLEEGAAAGPVEQILTDLPRRGDWSNWDLWSGGLVLLDRDDEGPFLLRHEFASGKTSKITRVPNVASPSVTASPDGRHLLYARIENSIVDLVLVEGFR